MKKYDIYLSDLSTHKVSVKLTIKTDGYITALAEASKIKESHPNLYVSKVEKV